MPTNEFRILFVACPQKPWRRKVNAVMSVITAIKMRGESKAGFVGNSIIHGTALGLLYGYGDAYYTGIYAGG